MVSGFRGQCSGAWNQEHRDMEGETGGGVGTVLSLLAGLPQPPHKMLSRQFCSIFQTPSQRGHCEHPQVLAIAFTAVIRYLYWEFGSQCISLFDLILYVFVETRKFPF